MRSVFVVSKPLEPPWTDGSKNLARDLLLGLERYPARGMGRQGGARHIGGIALEPVYPRRSPSGGPGFGAHEALYALRWLAFGARAPLWHFFFTPNPRTSGAARLVARLRAVRTVQTVCSAPALVGSSLRSLCFTDRIVVLSRKTEHLLLDAGLERERVVRIAPCAPPLTPPAAAARLRIRRALGLPAQAPVVVYPGDLEHEAAALRVLEAHGRLSREAWLVMACRTKSKRSARAYERLAERARRLGTEPRVRWAGTSARILQWLAGADVVALPTETLCGKLDLPLVLLEAMALGRPVIVCEGTSAAELAEDGAAVAVPPDADALAHALARLLDDGQLRSDLGERALRTVRERHDRSAMARAYEAVYDALW
ncbi:MAG: glycosyltransferase family 4 protein [Myxococcota bacterium]|nr:glycosyltransferase family 4 protein [Myxococcota bacterium]MDW8361088.1 glycosyltransferase family 4 protein [Myxococcales bacterium]